MKMPQFDTLFNPIINALKNLGGSATNAELVSETLEITKLPEKVANIPHSDTDSRTEFEYRLAWAKTYLKKYGIITNSERSVWVLTKKGLNTESVKPKEVVAYVKSQQKATAEEKSISVVEEEEVEKVPEWKEKILKQLYNLSPDSFERLCLRILREAGFTKLKITGKSGDGGIDGVGIMQFSLINFPIVFQCKRYQGSVSSPIVRNFRGAMVGRVDKGLIMTTGNFTRDAIKEAEREGAPVIDLIDGEKLIDLLKQFSLGIKKSTVEIIEVDDEWFESL